MNTDRVAAVVVDWNRPVETLDALRSLASMDPTPDDIICVENGCSAAGVDSVRAAAPTGTVVIELPENSGFAGGVNAGMEAALRRGGRWVLLLNNDALVEIACLRRCLAEATSTPGIAVAGPAVSFADKPDRLWYGGGRASRRFAVPRHRGLRGNAATPPPTSDTAFVPACCALVSAEAWRAIGPFRADYFLYYEDVEWCLRARAAGWRCRYVGEVLCRHAVGASAGQRGSLGLSETTAYYLARNPLRFAVESRSRLLRLSRIAALLTVWLGYNAWRAVRTGDLRVALAYLEGLRDAVAGRMGPRPAHGSSAGAQP